MFFGSFTVLTLFSLHNRNIQQLKNWPFAETVTHLAGGQNNIKQQTHETQKPYN